MCMQAWGTHVEARDRQQVTCSITLCLIPVKQSHTLTLEQAMPFVHLGTAEGYKPL